MRSRYRSWAAGIDDPPPLGDRLRRWGPVVAVIGFAVWLLAACQKKPDCNELRHDRTVARENLELDQARARNGDSYAANSLQYDRNEYRKAEKQYDEACLK